MNSDASIESKLDELALIFPDKRHAQILRALESANGDSHEACAILLSESSSEPVQVSDPLDELKAMFPNVDSKTIEDVYQRSKSIEAATSELLSLPMLSLVDDEEQKHAERQLKDGQCDKITNNQNAWQKTSWKMNSDKIRTIRHYTAVSDTKARQAFHENSFSAVKSIIQLIWDQNYFSNSGSKHKEPEPRVKKSRGGRVQAATGFAHATGFADESKSSFKVLENTDNDADVADKEVEGIYVYSDNSKEAQELKDVLQSNAELRTINLAFLKRALTFYRGDLQLTMSLALFILEANGAKATYHSVPDPKEMFNFTIAQSKSQKNKATAVSIMDTTHLTPQAFQNDEHYHEGRRMIQNVLTTTRFDFHGFVPKDAIQVLQECLDKWWNQEIREREMNSQNLSISKALNVAPIEIVTGRGIHSAGGISTLKIKVRKFLNDNHYVYWEEPAYFIVQGRKSSRIGT